MSWIEEIVKFKTNKECCKNKFLNIINGCTFHKLIRDIVNHQLSTIFLKDPVMELKNYDMRFCTMVKLMES
jgi:hypothetical protein